MTFRRWWTARLFLFDEKFGPLIRAAEREARQAEAKQAADYARSVAMLKAQGSTDGVR